jgi:hypothetical protein
MRTFTEVEDWLEGAEAEFGDPSIPVCQLFVRYIDAAQIANYRGEELVVGGANPVLWLTQEIAVPISIVVHENPGLGTASSYCVNAAGELTAFAAVPVVKGVWFLEPSLHVLGLIHAFVVFYDVPEPAPWERKIIIAA